MTVSRIRCALLTCLEGVSSRHPAGSGGVKALKELCDILQSTLLKRYATSKKVTVDTTVRAQALFPTAVETALVEASIMLDHLHHDSDSMQSTLLPPPATLYRTFMVERYKQTLLYDRTATSERFAQLWRKDVDTNDGGGGGATLRCRYEDSSLSTALAVPAVGHATLGAMLADAFDLLRHVIGIQDVWISGGTLLGAVRSKQQSTSKAAATTTTEQSSSFIPWDDDLDITITRREELKLLAHFGLIDVTTTTTRGQQISGVVSSSTLLSTSSSSSIDDDETFECRHKHRRWVIEHCPLFGYKLYDKNCIVPLGCQDLLERGAMCFGAFVDIFVIGHSKESTGRGRGGTDDGILVLNRSAARATWPREQYDVSKTFPLKPLVFSYPSTLSGAVIDTTLLAPCCPEGYLDSLYGPQWASIAVVPQQLHYGLVLPSELRIDKASFLS